MSRPEGEIEAHLLILKNLYPSIDMGLADCVILPAMRKAVEAETVRCQQVMARRFHDAIAALVPIPEPAPPTIKMQYRDETGVHDFPTWRDVPITAGLLADFFDAYCGADGHNLVVQTVNNHLGRKTNG